ncbi:MAG: CvpA family protein [Deltaproteobacteria bacterium]|nr:CvpA family protein [Deltaproteobacteria bacterium]
MNGIDIAILVILCFFFLKGLIRGFIKEIFTIVGLLIAFFLAILYYPQTADLLEQFFQNLSYRNLLVLSFLSLFLAVYIIIIVLALILDRFVKVTMAKPINILLGGVVGFAKGIILASLLLLVVSGFIESNSTILRESLTRPYLRFVTTSMLKLIPADLEKYLDLEKKKLPQKLEGDLIDLTKSKGGLKLPKKVPARRP